jgi:hypothetical protein
MSAAPQFLAGIRRHRFLTGPLPASTLIAGRIGVIAPKEILSDENWN